MASSLPNFVKNFSEVIYRIKFKFRDDDKKRGRCGINLSIATVFLNTKILKML